MQDELGKLRSDLESELSIASDDYVALAGNAAALDNVLALANIRMRLLELRSEHFQNGNPALWTGEAIFGTVSLIIRDFSPPGERLAAIAARLAAVSAFLVDMRVCIVAPVPERWRDRAVRECNAAIELFGNGLDAWIHEHFADADANVFAKDLTAVRHAARDARTALAEARGWLEGCAIAQPDAYAIGEDSFAEIITCGHFCEESPRVLLERAESELRHERASALLNNWVHTQAAIAADHPTTSEYYETFNRRWHEIESAVVANGAVNWPTWPIRYVPIQAWAESSAPQLYWLFYRSPAPFDSYSTYDYVVTPIDHTMSDAEQERRLRVWNHSTITLNHVVHHGGVGHHVQNWNARYRSTSRIGAVAAVDCASRIGMFLGGSMAEGWACYATELVEELGMLAPLERASQQHTRVRQLARAVVDIRLHTRDWSFAQCAEFYVQQTGMSPDMANAETTKNSMFPGTALMYWLGTSGILNLRSAVQTARGEQFNLAAFHDELLGRGSIPVPLAARLMLSTLNQD